MSRFTTYFKGSDSHLFGSTGDATGAAFPQATFYGSNTAAYPDSLYTADDGGTPLLSKQLVLNNGTAAFVIGTCWARFPSNSVILDISITTSTALTAGTFALYWQRPDKSVAATLLIGPVGGAAITTPALPTSTSSALYTSGSLNTTSGLSNNVLRWDVAGITPAAFNGTITALINYVVIPTND